MALKLLYGGGSVCAPVTLKRLLIVGDELAFMDRPSVTFKQWGTVGQSSPMRRLPFKTAPVQVRVFEPPSGPAEHFFLSYIEADLTSPDFRRIFLDGLKADDAFASKFLQISGEKAEKGIRARSALTSDPQLLTAPFVTDIQYYQKTDLNTAEGRLERLKHLLIEASIHVTNAMLVAEETGFVPIGDDLHMVMLLESRLSRRRYVGKGVPAAPFLGLEIARSVIPDEMLRNLEFEDIIGYRCETADLYRGWSTEINKLAAELDQCNASTIRADLPRLLASHVEPQINQYKNDMASIRDRLFGDLVKRLSTWEMPTLAIAYLSGMNLSTALALFAAALAPAVPPLVDYMQARRDSARNHAMAYLVELRRKVEH